VREKSLNRGDYTEAKKCLLEDIQDAVVVNLTPSIVATSIEMLESCPLRAMDALQVACAREWGAEVFVSADQRQISAAKDSGLQVSSV
jgi:predicted nucleic acid-binding protein